MWEALPIANLQRNLKKVSQKCISTQNISHMAAMALYGVFNHLGIYKLATSEEAFLVLFEARSGTNLCTNAFL